MTSAHHVEEHQVAVNGDAEHEVHDEQDAGQFGKANRHVRRDLPEHEPHGLYRRHEELLERPVLSLTHDGNRLSTLVIICRRTATRPGMR